MKNKAINLDFSPKRIKCGELKWVSADLKATYHRNHEGWYAYSQSADLRSAMIEMGLTYEDPLHCSSLKEIRQIVQDIADQAGIQFNSLQLTRPRRAYQIGLLPCVISKSRDNPKEWRLGLIFSSSCLLPDELEPFFSGGPVDVRRSFNEAFEKSGLSFNRYETRGLGCQGVKTWLDSHINSHN
jgi:hypothetical protein